MALLGTAAATELSGAVFAGNHFRQLGEVESEVRIDLRSDTEADFCSNTGSRRPPIPLPCPGRSPPRSKLSFPRRVLPMRARVLVARLRVAVRSLRVLVDGAQVRVTEARVLVTRARLLIPLGVVSYRLTAVSNRRRSGPK